MNFEEQDSKSYINKRKFERAYFCSEDDVTFIMMISGNSSLSSEKGKSRAVCANISNMSLGGAFIVVDKVTANHFDVGSILIFNEIKSKIFSTKDLNLEAKVLRVHRHEYVDHVGYGCQFTNIAGRDYDEINKLIELALHSSRKKGE